MNDEERVRLDKWLWAARFFKTRSLATDAINAGHVDVNDVHAKPARPMREGDRVAIRKEHQEWVVVVRGVSERRGSATEAQKLYEETEESRSRREALIEQRRFSSTGAPAPERRPDKRDRRRIIRFAEKGR
jgi:ribosome-associated heat shock protein Hsp15